MGRLSGIFLKRVGLNLYSFKDVEGKLHTLECSFDPFCSLITYELETNDPENAQDKLRVEYIHDTNKVPFTQEVYFALFPMGQYVEGDDLPTFLNRVQNDPSTFHYKAVLWIQWNKFCYILDLFRTTHYDRMAIKYIEEKGLLRANLLEWLQTEEAMQCPWRIHPDVLRLRYPGAENSELIDDVAIIQEIKYAMCKEHSRFVTDKQLMRAFNHCSDVKEAMKRLIARGVLKDLSQPDTVIVTFTRWRDSEAVQLDPDQPLEPYVHRLIPWTYHAIPDTFTSGTYYTFGDTDRKHPRMFLPYSNRPKSTFADIREFLQVVKAKRVVFVFGYAALTLSTAVYEAYPFTNWRLMRHRSGEYVFIQRTENGKFKLFKQGDFSKQVIQYANELQVAEIYHPNQVLRMSQGVDETVLGWCDQVMFMSRKRTPRAWLNYLDRVCQGNLCVVGEMPCL